MNPLTCVECYKKIRKNGKRFNCEHENCENVYCNTCIEKGYDRGYTINIHGHEYFTETKTVILCPDCEEDDEDVYKLKSILWDKGTR